MSTNIYYSIGLMSGSSLDGLDIIYCRIDSLSYSYDIIYSDTVSYSLSFYNDLKNAHLLSSKDLIEFDNQVGIVFGKICKDFIIKNKIVKIDYISSHGHTVFHEPQRGFTLQIGNGYQISKITGIKTITNFRNKDIANGGQGAPIVPLADKLLFKDYKYCLNLGGISNISIKLKEKIIAFDISICNQILNFYAQKLGKEYDENGELSIMGSLNKDLFNSLNNMDFCTKLAPKSLSNEYLINVIKITSNHENRISYYDILNTCCHHIAYQISKYIDDPKEKLLITGGGTYHLFLLKCIKHYSSINIVIPSNKVINYKESLAMSLLGLYKLMDKPNVFSSVTGALTDTVNGEIFENK